jgi:hypothetical protein
MVTPYRHHRIAFKVQYPKDGFKRVRLIWALTSLLWSWATQVNRAMEKIGRAQ